MYKEKRIMRKVTNDLKVNLIENMGNRIRSFNQIRGNPYIAEIQIDFYM